METKPIRRPEFDPMRMLREIDHDFPAWPWNAFRRTKSGTGWLPSVDVYDEDGSVVVKAEVPGMTKDDIKVRVEDDNLVIEGERKSETEKKEKDYYFCEREYGSFYRRIPLPAAVDSAKTEATVKDGVLTVRAPRTIPVPKAHTIAVN
ncbi:MAG: Hsp20/alpha crystallin family protein [Dehalococcoidia bacterium]